jgi:hypothetical protein
MKNRLHIKFVILGVAASLSGYSGVANANNKAFERMMAGESAIQGKKLDKLIAKADKHPLGSKENPVRVSRPEGQRAYLASLLCADGKTPAFSRVGNFGVGVFGNIVDGYEVTCAGSTPEKTIVMMDMYHAGRTESRTIEGFTKVQ